MATNKKKTVMNTSAMIAQAQGTSYANHVANQSKPTVKTSTAGLNTLTKAKPITPIVSTPQKQSITPQLTQTQQTQSVDIQAMINSLNQAKQAQAIADLGKARDTQLSTLATEEASIKPTYDTKRNAAAATNMMGRRTLAEELASRGETNSGVADQANINANMSLQSDLGTLNAQEASNLTDIANRRTGINNAYESDVASTKANLDAVSMQNQIDQYNSDRQFDYQKSRDAVSDTQWQQQMNLNLRQQSFSEAQQKIDNALSQRRISQQDASQALEWARFNAEQDPNSLDNQIKKQQVDSNSQSKLSSQINSIIDNYNNLYTTKKYDKTSGLTTTTPDKPSILQSLQASVQNGNMSESTARQIAGYYGISL